jgi:hypothetical protein
MPQLVPPPPLGEEFEHVSWQQFFEILRKQVNQPAYYSQSTDPGTTGVPSGTWSVWLNTTSGVLKIWANQAGVMKSVTLT